MRQRYRLYFREKTGRYYIHDDVTGKQESLRTKDKATAERLFHSRNEAEKQPAINLQIARAYLAATDAEISTRTWQQVMDEMVKLKTGETQRRWLTAINDKALDSIRNRPILETRAEHFLRVLETGTVSTNVYLRRVHNFTLDMSWLPWPVIVKRRWPKVEHKEKRAITLEEHRRIVEREKNPELKAFYELAWHVGASQSDLANLQAEDIDWSINVISFFRMKTRWRGQQPPQIRFGAKAETLLRSLPVAGPLFPKTSRMHEKHRAKEFKRRCVGLEINGITLHSYRYAWAERAKTAGYPERFAQVALGHNCKAVSRAYAKKAQVIVPPLEDYEHKVIQLPVVRQTGIAVEPSQVVNA